MKILVVTEHRQGKWNNTSFETLAAAQQIAKDTSSTVSGLVIGKSVSGLADELATKNIAEVLLVEHDLLDAYTADGYCVALKQVIESAKPDLILFPHTYQVRDFAPKLAAQLGKGMIGDCIGYRNESGKPIFVRQMFQGKTNADVTFQRRRPMVCLVPGRRFSLGSGHRASVRQSSDQRGVGDARPGPNPHQASRSLQRSEISHRSHASSAHRSRRPRHQSP